VNKILSHIFKKVLYKFNDLSVYKYIYMIYVICSRIEQKLSWISKIYKRRLLCNLMLSVLSSKKIGWELRDQKWNRLCGPSVDRKFWIEKENINFIKNLNPPSSKTECGLKNQYDLVWSPSIGNFIWSKEKYREQKGKNKLLEPKNIIWASKSVWSCDREFYKKQEKNSLRSQKREY
jgi:hypothetical protein